AARPEIKSGIKVHPTGGSVSPTRGHDPLYVEEECNDDPLKFSPDLYLCTTQIARTHAVAIVYARFVIHVSCGTFCGFLECNFQRKPKEPWVEGARDSWVAVADADPVDSAAASCQPSRSRHQLD
ncbi:hypothetical protein AVEN_211476-1, partial [Araneus ventricosus]